LQLFDHAQPYVGQLMVQLVDARSGTPLLLPDGSDRLLLPPQIQIDTDTPTISQVFNTQFGTSLSLWCASITEDNDTFDIRLFWHVNTTMERDLTTFVHGLDADNQIVAQGDAPPIPAYPTSLWREGQTLVAKHTLPADEAIVTVGIGLYDAEGVRISVEDEDAIPLPDSRLTLPLETRDCVVSSGD
ncbi:MAG: hypothetical protein AAF125_05935, partial [Chloroflexota bacterium]